MATLSRAGSEAEAYFSTLREASRLGLSQEVESYYEIRFHEELARMRQGG